MLEVAPGVYTAPRLSRSVRERIWNVLNDWHLDGKGAVVMTWPDKASPGGQAIATIGTPPVTIVEVDGMFLAYRPQTECELRDEKEKKG
jgi:CRISPR-associated protein Cas2